MPTLFPSFSPEKIVVFFDFDNTISDFDILDAVIERFATGSDWQEAEKRWENGEIGARDCLDIQMRALRVTPRELSDFLAPIRLDPGFENTLQWLREKGIQHSILSDNFTQIIARILDNNQIENVPIYANTMRFEGDRIVPSFPFYDDTCPRCAHCKKIHLLERTDTCNVYVGDGRSDLCPALIADRVYARTFLLDHLTKIGHAPIPFEKISDVLSDLRIWLGDRESVIEASSLLA